MKEIVSKPLVANGSRLASMVPRTFEQLDKKYRKQYLEHSGK